MQTSGANRLSEEPRVDNPNFSHSLCDLTPWWFSISVMLFNIFSTTLSRLSWPFSVLSVFLLSVSSLSPPRSLSLFLSLCSTESNGDRPSPTGLCWRPTLRRWSVSLTSSTLSLPPSVPSPSSLSGSVCHISGHCDRYRDSRTTSQFPLGLDCFTLGLQKDFQWTWLYTHT